MEQHHQDQDQEPRQLAKRKKHPTRSPTAINEEKLKKTSGVCRFMQAQTNKTRQALLKEKNALDHIQTTKGKRDTRKQDRKSKQHHHHQFHRHTDYKT
jgi:hypothetical protein